MSWAAIIGGAVVASATSLILLALGTGIGLSSVSPFEGSGASGTAFSIGAAIWLIIIQIVSSGLGGYLAGRLRTRWAATHGDEVYFRDTAHGFMVWALGVIVSATLLTSAASGLLGTATQATGSVLSGLGSAASSVAGGAASGAANGAASNANAASSYFTDMLFRTDKPAAADAANSTQEVGRIMSRSLVSGEIAPADKTYVAQLIANRTGISQADAEKRIDDTLAQAKAAAAKAEQTAREAADTARKAASAFSLWLFLSMLIGAFSASIAATMGGRARDLVTGPSVSRT